MHFSFVLTQLDVSGAIARAVTWEPRKVKSWPIRNGEGKIDQHHEWPALNIQVPLEAVFLLHVGSYADQGLESREITC
ncbi:hypothetical protein HBH56_238570 [Parastagonospora nodorum]|nr:hypothetical protein HBH56_238570 [Parastagonospora nodorum]KAH3925880.1 hypothetical protein HBH54_177360 [Parastagonospora nodorum]KAH4000383.1 hypothetical protein HBI10_101650 [Parastagonospora nodorum]KAH4051958.1 hypothetical protein HBH49_110150 [Parastagonospora nodorum]KAH4103016.1 hypothetical protein HBH46_120110 [Parastagonospora nodorum]